VFTRAVQWYCWCLVTFAVVDGSYHLSRSGESSLVSVGTSSLEWSVLKCGQATQPTIHLTTLQDAAFQTGSTHSDKTAPPPSARDGMTPLTRLKLRGTNSTYPEPHQSNPYHAILSKIQFNTVHPPTCLYFQWSLSFWLPHQYPICIPLLPHSCYMPCSSSGSVQ
jgi:hypothetical protein